MKNSSEKPQNFKALLQGRYLSILLICAILIASGVLYVVAKLNTKTDVIPVAASPSQTTTVTVTPQAPSRIYVSEEVFLQRMKEYGYTASAEKGTTYPSMVKYTLTGTETFQNSELVLSLNDAGGVYSFSLICSIPNKPHDLSKSPTALEIAIHDQLEYAYNGTYEWMHSCIQSLSMALDFDSDLTYADISGFNYSADTAIDDQKENKSTVGDFVCAARGSMKDDKKSIEFSLSIDTDAQNTKNSKS